MAPTQMLQSVNRQAWLDALALSFGNRCGVPKRGGPSLANEGVPILGRRVMARVSLLYRAAARVARCRRRWASIETRWRDPKGSDAARRLVLQLDARGADGVLVALLRQLADLGREAGFTRAPTHGRDPKCCERATCTLNLAEHGGAVSTNGLSRGSPVSLALPRPRTRPRSCDRALTAR